MHMHIPSQTSSNSAVAVSLSSLPVPPRLSDKQSVCERDPKAPRLYPSENLVPRRAVRTSSDAPRELEPCKDPRYTGTSAGGVSGR